MFAWFNFLVYAVTTAGTPGPNNILSMSNGSRSGFRRALPFNLGLLAGQSVLMLLCALFCALLSAYIPKIELPMKLVGAAYILWLAWKIFRSTGELEEVDARSGWTSGVLVQFVNPKLYLYGIVSMEVYILPAYGDALGMVALFALLLAVLGFLSSILWLACGLAFKKLFSKYARITNTVMALLLVYCAAALFM